MANHTPTPPQPFGEEREMVAKGAAFVPIGNMRALLAALDAANKANADLETVCQLQLVQIRESATALDAKTAEVERLKADVTWWTDTCNYWHERTDDALRRQQFSHDLNELAEAELAAERDRAAEAERHMYALAECVAAERGAKLRSLKDTDGYPNADDLANAKYIAQGNTPDTARARVKVLEEAIRNHMALYECPDDAALAAALGPSS